MSISGSDALLLKTTGGTIVKNQTVTDLGNYLSTSSSLSVQICGGRLGLESGVPISTTDKSGASAATIYLNAYQSNWVLLYDGTSWVRRSFSTPSVSPPSVATKAFDIFAYWTGSAVALETINWTNDTTRATSLTRQDGILVKNGDATRLYLGSARTVASGQTESSSSKRFLWNFYNPVAASFNKQLLGTAAAYDSTTVRQIAANSGNQVEAIVGLEGGHGASRISVTILLARGGANNSNVGYVSVNIDSTNTIFKVANCDTGLPGGLAYCTGFWEGFIPLGVHYFSGNQAGAGASPPTYCNWYMAGAQLGFSGSILC